MDRPNRWTDADRADHAAAYERLMQNVRRGQAERRRRQEIFELLRVAEDHDELIVRRNKRRAEELYEARTGFKNATEEYEGLRYRNNEFRQMLERMVFSYDKGNITLDMLTTEIRKAFYTGRIWQEAVYEMFKHPYIQEMFIRDVVSDSFMKDYFDIRDQNEIEDRLGI